MNSLFDKEGTGLKMFVQGERGRVSSLREMILLRGKETLGGKSYIYHYKISAVLR